MSSNSDYFDEDENVRMMRDTARRVGLTDLLISLRSETDPETLRQKIPIALALLGVK